MKNLAITVMLILGTVYMTNAQQMNCSGSKTGAKVTLLSHVGTTIKLKVDWDEGSTFSSSSLAITNGTCTTCPRIGGIGRPHGVQKTYTITQTNSANPVTIKWGTRGTDKYCGNSQIITGGGLFCDSNKTGAKVTFLSKSGNIIKVKVDWNEGAGFNKNSLAITNGSITTTFNLGGGHKKQAVVEIKQTNTSKPVQIRWASPNPSKYCGTGVLTIN